MNTKLNSFLREHSLAISLALLSLIVALAGKEFSYALRYEHNAIHQGEIWRLLTGQLAHLGWSHLILNLFGLGLIWGLFWNAYQLIPWLIITLLSALGVGAGLYFLSPEVSWYVGLSGLLHGLFVAGAIGGIRRGDRREAILLLAIVAKLLWEQAFGALPGSAEMAEGPVIVDAHFYGAIGGMIGAWLFKPRLWC